MTTLLDELVTHIKTLVNSHLPDLAPDKRALMNDWEHSGKVRIEIEVDRKAIDMRDPRDIKLTAMTFRVIGVNEAGDDVQVFVENYQRG